MQNDSLLSIPSALFDRLPRSGGVYPASLSPASPPSAKIPPPDSVTAFSADRRPRRRFGRGLAAFAGLLLATGLGAALPMAPASAEPAFNFDVWEGAKAYYQPGFSFLDTNSLNQLIAPAGYANYSNTFLTQGGGAQVILDRIVIGGSGFGLSGFRAASGKGETLAVSGGYGLLNLGYVIVRQKNFSLYPMIGIGSGGVKINSSEALNKLFSFTSNSDVFELQSSQIVMDIGLGADYLIDFNADRKLATGLDVGLKLGYVFVPSPPQWESAGRPVGGSVPNLNTQGVYLSLSLGLGAQRERKDDF